MYASNLILINEAHLDADISQSEKKAQLIHPFNKSAWHFCFQQQNNDVNGFLSELELCYRYMGVCILPLNRCIFRGLRNKSGTILMPFI